MTREQHPEHNGIVAPPVVSGAAALTSVLRDNFKKIGPAMGLLGVQPDFFCTMLINVGHRNPKLLECDPVSVLAAGLQAAYLGLQPDDTLGQAYLIPYGKTCKLQVGYKGLVTLVRRQGNVAAVNAEVVYINEYQDKTNFELGMGSPRVLRHMPYPPSQRGDAIVGAYATVTTVIQGNGFDQWDWMWIEDMERIRQAVAARNRGKESPAWKEEHTRPEMYKKTVLKRTCKRLNLNPLTARAIHLDDQYELGQEQNLELLTGLEEGGEPGERQTRKATEDLKQRLANAGRPMDDSEQCVVDVEVPGGNLFPDTGHTSNLTVDVLGIGSFMTCDRCGETFRTSDPEETLCRACREEVSRASD